MARHDDLPTEIWAFVIIKLDMGDRMSVTATCRYFRAFWALAWAQITLPVQHFEVEKLVKKLMRLAATLKADSSLQPLVQGIYLHRLRGPEPKLLDWNYPDDNGELDVAVAGVLYLVPRVECFVFEASESDWHVDDQVLQALCKLPVLKTLVLAYLQQYVLDREYCLESRVLERLIITCERVGFCNFIGEQKLLKSVELPV
jgi:hypothetical protein